MTIKKVNTSELHYFEEFRDYTFGEATRSGMTIILPTSCQLQLDIDMPFTGKSNYSTLPGICLESIRRNLKKKDVLNRLIDQFSITKYETWKSKSGNTHVMITLKQELPETERIALQLVLGSDPMRELLNLRRVMCGASDPIALFRPAESNPFTENLL